MYHHRGSAILRGERAFINAANTEVRIAVEPGPKPVKVEIHFEKDVQKIALGFGESLEIGRSLFSQ